MQINTYESGRTMIEMIGVLSVIGVLTVGALSTVNYGLDTFRVSSMFSLVETTAENVSDLYSWRREFPNNAKVMRQQVCRDHQVFDKDCVGSAEEDPAKIETPWGYLMVEPNTNTNFQIRLTNVPYSACNKLLNEMKWTNVTPQSDVECREEGTELIFFGN